jgi:hypothetical protein
LNNDRKKSVPRVPKDISDGHSTKINSEIITFQHTELISKWIDKLEIKEKLISSYEFKLLYRDSRDRPIELHNRFENFHKICDNQSRTVTIIKVEDSNEILGGFNPIKWKTDGNYGVTKDSFIFAFNNDGIEDYILSRVKNEKKAILNCSIYDGFGPLFGDKDLLLYQTFDNELKVSCEKKDYEKRIRKINNSRVLEFEVFKVQIVYF